MSAAITAALANGTLKRLPGGYWVDADYKWVSGCVPHPSITSKTIQALVARGLMEYAEEGKVRVKA